MKFLTFDLGTGGVKSSLYDEKLTTLGKTFIEYPTFYPEEGYHEQRPEDWWTAVAESVRRLLEKTGVSPEEIQCISSSGHSCVAVPLDADGNRLTEQVPIWSDSRAEKQTQEFFEKVSEKEWYEKTGNGFPPACYMIFKLMWLKERKPEVYRNIHRIVGSKDYINFRLSGKIATDHTYAASFGVYDLENKKIDEDLVEKAGISMDVFPELVYPHTVIGEITPEAAAQTGLAAGTKVVCGGVDNSCMALGSVGPVEGAFYLSLGASSWIPVNSRRPVLDFQTRPYVFPIADGSGFTSAYSIFAGGSAYQWARNVLCSDLNPETAYQEMDRLAAQSPVGANGVIFNPTLAGGTSQDKNTSAKGAFIGLQLGTNKGDLLRAVLEGVACNLKLSFEKLCEKAGKTDKLLIFGGGSKSDVWMQIFADVFEISFETTNIDQDAASLGAAAIGARAMGMWEDYSSIPSLHTVKNVYQPNQGNAGAYHELMSKFIELCDVVADFGTKNAE